MLNSLAAKQIKSEGKLSQVGAIKLQTGLPLFRPMWASSVQCRHWSRHMAKASFIPHAWVTNTHKSKCSHLATPECSKTPVRVNHVASLFLVGRAHWFAWNRQKKKWPRVQRYRAFWPFSGARTRPMQHVQQLLRMLHSTGLVSADLLHCSCSTLSAKLRCDCR